MDMKLEYMYQPLILTYENIVYVPVTSGVFRAQGYHMTVMWPSIRIGMELRVEKRLKPTIWAYCRECQTFSATLRVICRSVSLIMRVKRCTPVQRFKISTRLNHMSPFFPNLNRPSPVISFFIPSNLSSPPPHIIPIPDKSNGIFFPESRPQITSETTYLATKSGNVPKTTIGYIGHGVAGFSMATSLPRAGYHLVYDASPTKAAHDAAEWPHTVNPRGYHELFAECDMVITMLPEKLSCGKVLLGK